MLTVSAASWVSVDRSIAQLINIRLFAVVRFLSFNGNTFFPIYPCSSILELVPKVFSQAPSLKKVIVNLFYTNKSKSQFQSRKRSFGKCFSPFLFTQIGFTFISDNIHVQSDIFSIEIFSRSKQRIERKPNVVNPILHVTFFPGK